MFRPGVEQPGMLAREDPPPTPPKLGRGERGEASWGTPPKPPAGGYSCTSSFGREAYLFRSRLGKAHPQPLPEGRGERKRRGKLGCEGTRRQLLNPRQGA